MPKLEGGMGFRNHHDFNLALLAKQSWRLLIEQNSFWALIMKSRYFPSCNFLKASKGARASWAWASMLEGREVIIRVLPDGLLHPINDELVDENVFVSEIINPITKSWDLSNLNGRISDQDARRIKAMPVGGGCESDQLVWPFSVSGYYSVKIGYYSIHPCYHPNHRHMRASGSHCVSKKVWKLIWCSPLIPKIKNFMWRAVKGCLPTKALLFHRHLGSSPLCPVCENEPETIEHLLLYCIWTPSVWFGSLLCY
ncbi:unnamed protein product [Prunus armeniaca]